MDHGSRLLRIGIFYDGNYFYHVSNYYCYAHTRRARLSIPGIHDFVKKMVSDKENVDEQLCQIVDCHYFRGRLPAMEAKQRNILLNERVFDDVLMREGVVTHYQPMPRGTEKGVDVSLALEALELSIYKHFNVVVLIASDGDYVPLVRKLNSLGIRVMVLAWDFEYMDDNGNLRYTGTSQKLLSEVSYPLQMDQIIDGKISPGRVPVDQLFVAQNGTAFEQLHEPQEIMYNADDYSDDYPEELETAPAPGSPNHSDDDAAGNQSTASGVPHVSSNGAPRYCGRIVQLKNGYGFIAPENSVKNLFFFWEDLVDCDFNALQCGDDVEYELGKNMRGECAKNIRLL
ncbi:MAG: NYN domain-containing protein [Lentisphaeria bacterium]|nr:NYN domain-containing protein [Lentisphaeria bacterium]